MIILPIGHEESSVRRLPWVTFAIMGLCAVLLIGLDPGVPVAVVAGEVDGGRPVADALAVAAVGGLARKPVLVLDLLANWTSLEDEILRVVRLRSDAFDPRQVVGGQGSPVAAFRVLVEPLLEATGGQALPNRRQALGEPFASHDDLVGYERTVLKVG